jgi:lipopolysaccharide/colanic/teichoic acid biosynthesis glycosyltransferase
LLGPSEAQRLEELLVALAVGVLVLPLVALVALAIKCDSSGPILTQHRRAGAGRSSFTAYKFRCTPFDSVPQRKPLLRMIEGVTRIGRFLRYSRIENLPQLINVLQGEMSCINPRSERPFFLD